MTLGMNYSYRPISSYELTLPPSHLLPSLQSENKNYDRYFLSFLADLRLEVTRIQVIDVGANVGDTALAIISVIPEARVVAVEGSPFFLKFLNKNTEPYDNVTVIPKFVAVGDALLSYESDGSTGNLKPNSKKINMASHSFVSVKELLSRTSIEDFVIWKTDTDGHDISILMHNFTELTKSCSILWFEYDPVDAFCDFSLTERLLTEISALSLDMLVFDNLGHLVFHESCKRGAPILRQLTHWLQSLESSNSRLTRIAYFDVWIMERQYANMFSKQA